MSNRDEPQDTPESKSPAAENGRAQSKDDRFGIDQGQDNKTGDDRQPETAIAAQRVPSHLRPETLAATAERDRLLVEAAARYFPRMGSLGAANMLHDALVRYRAGDWRDDRRDDVLPSRHRDRLAALLWQMLKVRDSVPSATTIRRALNRAKAAMRTAAARNEVR